MALLASIGQQFSDFLTNIQLTDKQREDAQTKYDGVCGKLHSNYYGATYDGSTKLLAGSYGKKTAISPPSDIDVIFLMPYSEFERYNSRFGNGQSHLLQDIKNILLTRYPNTDIRGDGPVVKVNFESYNIEVVPSFLLSGSYYIPDTHDGGKWKQIAPKSEIENIQASNKLTDGNTMKLIKIIKAWKYNCNVPIKSLVIELTMIDFLKTCEYYNKSSVYYDWIVRDYFEYLLSKVSSFGLLPITYEIIFYGNKWEPNVKDAISKVENACTLGTQNLHFAAATEWKAVFGPRFPYP